MGFKNDTRGGVYIKVIDGKFKIRVPEDTKGAVPRVLDAGPNSGDTIYELVYSSYEGHIKKAWIDKTGKYGATFNLKMADSQDSVTITVPFSSRHAKKFFAVMDNINLDKQVELSAFKIPKKDRDGKVVKDEYIHGWTVKQQNEAVEFAIQKEDIPEMVKVRLKGKDNWDDSAQLEFFEEKFNEWKEANFSEDDYEDKKTPSSKSKKDEDDSDSDDEEDDIPF